MKRVVSVFIASLLLASAWLSPAVADSFRDSFTITTIDVPGSRSTTARGINDAGQIVGDFQDATGSHGFLLSGGDCPVGDVRGPQSTIRGLKDEGWTVSDAIGDEFLV